MLKLTMLRNQVDILKITANAEFPVKTGASNVYDVSVVSRTENRGEDASLDFNNFHTGLQFKIPQGYYIELSAHPALYKFGYSFQGPFILDQNSSAELIITLFKFKEGDDIELPINVARMVAKSYSDVIFCAVHKKKTQVTDEEIEMPTYERSQHSKQMATAKSTKKKNASFF